VGLPWAVLEEAEERQLLDYYAIAMAEQELEAEQTRNALGA
jgi:hypothetical protein